MSEDATGTKRKIVIAGAAGFIGSHLLKVLKEWHIVTLDRRPNPIEGVESHVWDGQSQGDWVQQLEDAHAVVNLAGAPISVKWDEAGRQKIRSSRIEPTEAIGRAIASLQHPPKVWINASAVGYYGDRGDTVLYESAEPGVGFLSDVCRSWEQAAKKWEAPATRLVLMRTGFVLGTSGGAFKPLKMATLLGLGGAAGSGNQWIPWIHLEDMCRLFAWAADNPRVSGPLNGNAPEPVRNREFMSRLRKKLNRPWSPPAPSFALKLFGELTGIESTLILDSQRAIPRAAIDNGFTWNYPSLGEALHDLTKAGPGAFMA